MEMGILSARYAKALFAQAQEERCEAVLYANLQGLAMHLQQEPTLQTALSNPVLSAQQKLHLLITAGGSTVCDLYRRFMEVVIAHRRMAFLPFMAQGYLMRYRKAQRVMRVELDSAVPLSASLRKRLIARLAALSGNQIELQETVNPALIGGFRLRMEGQRLDASFARQLAEIRKQFGNPLPCDPSQATQQEQCEQIKTRKV